MLDTLNTTFASGKLRIYSGSAPATADLAATGDLLAEMTLPATPFGSAATGVIAKTGSWSDPEANDNGTAGYTRIVATGDDNTVTHTQPRMDLSTTAAGGGGEVILQNLSIATGQLITITSFTVSLGT